MLTDDACTYSFSVDFFSFGVVLFEAVVGDRTAFAQDRLCQVSMHELEGKASSALRDMICALLSFNVSCRLGTCAVTVDMISPVALGPHPPPGPFVSYRWQAVKQHPWFAGTDWVALAQPSASAPKQVRQRVRGMSSRYAA